MCQLSRFSREPCKEMYTLCPLSAGSYYYEMTSAVSWTGGLIMKQWAQNCALDRGESVTSALQPCCRIQGRTGLLIWDSLLCSRLASSWLHFASLSKKFNGNKVLPFFVQIKYSHQFLRIEQILCDLRIALVHPPIL